MQMILIAGKAGAGKTTLANVIASEVFKCGMVPVLLSFAGSLKKEAESRGYGKTDNPEKYREYCQEQGALMRSHNPDHWVDLLANEVSNETDKEATSLDAGNKFWERCIIIDDCRYSNEIGYGVKNNSILLFLSPGKRSLPAATWRAHESEELAHAIECNEENLQDLFHHIIYNDKDEKSLRKRVKTLIPIWCGLTACTDLKNDSCTCAVCTARREGTFPSTGEIITDLMDLMGEDWSDDEET